MGTHPSGMRDKLKTNRKYSINYCFLFVFVGTDPSEELTKGVYLGFEGYVYSRQKLCNWWQDFVRTEIL